MALANPVLYRFKRALGKLGACEQLNIELWNRCCAFFKHDREKTSTSERINISGLKRPLMLHQALCVFWQLEVERGVAGGGFIGDDMGLGKTMEVLATIVMERWLHLAHNDVARARKEGDTGTHLPEGTTENPQPPDARCPKPNRVPICCPCVDAGPSAKLLPKLGPVLIIVPPTLLINWLDEWNKVVEDEKFTPLRMKIFHQHGKASVSDRIKEEEKCQIRHKDGFAQARSERFVVLSSSQSYDRQVYQELRIQEPVPQPRPRKYTPRYYDGVIWGRIIRDEFHQEKGRDAKTPNLFQNFLGRPFTWMLSGTPFEVSPADMESYIKALQTDHWEKDPTFARCTAPRVKELGRWFKTALKNKKNRDITTIAKRFGFILRNLMIRRRKDSEWFDQPIIELPPHTSRDVDCRPATKHYQGFIEKMEQELTEGLQEAQRHRTQVWAAMGGEGSQPTVNIGIWFAKAHRLRIVTTIPALAKLSVEEGLRLTSQELKDNKWVEEPTKSPYYKKLDELVESSDKLQKVGKILSQLGTDWQGQPERIIIMSGSPVVVMVIFLWLQHRRHANVAMIHGGQSADERQSIVNSFEGIPDPMNKLPPPADVMVGTTTLLGTGYTCVKAFRIILMEPDFVMRNEMQAIGRICRIGQHNPRTYSYRMICTASATENTILTRQQGRDDFQSLAFAGVRLEESEDSDDSEEGSEAIDLDEDNDDDEESV
ncbi:MAG: hypothetical protein M1837_001839 [Sclerophora amabilis]|nr:MAG: hypothetical protein M1837_001839 [Sclerophora amabilis]